jgi:hypothetical protein
MMIAEDNWPVELILKARSLGVRLPTRTRGHRRWKRGSRDDHDRTGEISYDRECRYCNPDHGGAA